MLQFFIYFAIIQVVLFSTEQFSVVHENVIIPFTEFIACISAWLIQLFDDKVKSEGILLQQIDNGFSVSIQSGCNGVEAVIVLISAMLAFPAPWKSKLKGIIIGFFAVEILNIARIISLFYIGQWDKEFFDWAHLYIWEALIMLDVLIVFLLWLRLLPSTSNSLIENHAD